MTPHPNGALRLLTKQPVHGQSQQAVASGLGVADEEGRQVHQKVSGAAIFQIACSGSGEMTVTLALQHLRKVLACGEPAASVPFRGSLNALIVGARSNNGDYAWRILPAD